MDISETYIKMCEEAKEIQGLAPQIATRIHTKNGICICSDYEHGLGGFFYCLDHYEESDLGYNLLVSTDAVWLPRQDQLQEMYGDMDKCLSALYWWSEASCVGRTNCYHGYDSDEFKSMEQLWLAFIMKEKYNKIWNGEVWINPD